MTYLTILREVVEKSLDDLLRIEDGADSKLRESMMGGRLSCRLID